MRILSDVARAGRAAGRKPAVSLMFVLACGASIFAGGQLALGEEVEKAPLTRLIRRAPERGKAEVQWGGQWYPAEVLKEEDGKFYIKYDGYGDVWNEWVGKERIRFAGKVAVGAAKAEVESGGTWYPATVLETKDGKFHIKYDGWDDSWNEWVGKDRIRFPGKAAPEVTVCEVEWAGSWYPAKVLETKEGKFHIKYDGYGDEWNEWVGMDRIRFPAKKAAVALPDKVEVEWAGTWYPAKVIEKKDGKFHIKYDGYSDTFNEWVGPERIRAAKDPAKDPVDDAERRIKPRFGLPEGK